MIAASNGRLICVSGSNEVGQNFHINCTLMSPKAADRAQDARSRTGHRRLPTMIDVPQGPPDETVPAGSLFARSDTWKSLG